MTTRAHFLCEEEGFWAAHKDGDWGERVVRGGKDLQQGLASGSSPGSKPLLATFFAALLPFCCLPFHVFPVPFCSLVPGSVGHFRTE